MYAKVPVRDFSPVPTAFQKRKHGMMLPARRAGASSLSGLDDSCQLVAQDVMRCITVNAGIEACFNHPATRRLHHGPVK